MTVIEMKDRLQQQFDTNLPLVDTERGWDRLQAKLAERPSLEAARRRRRKQYVLAIATSLTVLVVAVLTAVSLVLSKDDTQVASAEGPTITASVPTSMTTDATSTPNTSTTEPSVETTSPGWGSRSRAAIGYSSHLGKTVISYLNGELDLASVQELVAPSARDGLALMLSSLSHPTTYEVTRTAGSDSGNVVRVWLRFIEADNQQSDFTLTALVETEDVAITAIERGAVPGP